MTIADSTVPLPTLGGVHSWTQRFESCKIIYFSGKGTIKAHLLKMKTCVEQDFPADLSRIHWGCCNQQNLQRVWRKSSCQQNHLGYDKRSQEWGPPTVVYLAHLYF